MNINNCRTPRIVSSSQRIRTDDADPCRHGALRRSLQRGDGPPTALGPRLAGGHPYLDVRARYGARLRAGALDSVTAHEESLLPCPFCGGTNLMRMPDAENPHERPMITCWGCGVTMA